MFGIYGTKPTRETLALLRETGAGGILLLGRNIETAAQTRALTRELVQRLGRPLIFAVDHEGGWVLRFKEGVTPFPGNAALGRTGDARLAYEVGRGMARDLGGLGIGLNLAPVLDVVRGYNPGIGIRSFGGDAALAGKLGAAMIRGMQEHGLSACAKHFPGKGAATVDAHVTLPVIRLPKKEFERGHLAPFRAAVEAGVDCVMTSHVKFPALDRLPATFSARITRDILRGRLGFDGVVIADDLCMGAVTESLPIQAAALKTLEAGHDILLIAHDARAQYEAVELLRRAEADGALNRRELERSLARVARLAAKKRSPARGGSPAHDRELSDRIAGKAVELISQRGPGLGWRPAGRPPLILFPDFREVRERFTFEGGPAGPQRWLKNSARRWGKVKILKTPVESRDLGRLPAAVRGADRVLLFCFEAMRFPGQRAALDLVQKSASGKTAVCLIRNPWDRSLLMPETAALDAKGYRLSSLKAALGRILRCALLVALCASAAPARAQNGNSVTELHSAFVSEVETAARKELLGRLSRTAPASPKEVEWLFDLFSRFPTSEVRQAAMASLFLLDPNDRRMDRLFLHYLEDSEAETVLFGINGAFISRTEKALPVIRKIAKRKFPVDDPHRSMFLTERNEWWVIYEALSVLARWEGEKSFDLLRKRAGESPKTARILGERLWEKSLPLFIEWLGGKKERQRAAAVVGLEADADPEALRRTRPLMLKHFRDPKADPELRRLLGVKLGRSSTDAEVGEFLAERERLEKPEERLLLAAALFASQNPRIVPLLLEFARKDPDPMRRAGALRQLQGMQGAAEYRKTLSWTAENDPEPEIRAMAKKALAETPAPVH